MNDRIFSTNGKRSAHIYKAVFFRYARKLPNLNMTSLNEFVEKNLTAECVGSLYSNGYVIMSGYIPAEVGNMYRAEIENLHMLDLLKPNKVQFNVSADKVYFATKPNIFEADMHDKTCQLNAELFKNILETDKIVDHLNNIEPRLNLLRWSSNKTVKLQLNSGDGACFPWHYDNPGKPNKRKLTMLVYLNYDWSEGHGGELVLWPFMRDKVEIKPTGGTLVLFRSDLILHRVLPCHKSRLCFTLWMESDDTNSDSDLLLMNSHLQLRPSFLQDEPLQRVLSRAVYREEYQLSIVECFGNESSQIPVAYHDAHVAALLKNESVKVFVDSIRQEIGLDS